jgi:quinol monooxygenase YgiN
MNAIEGETSMSEQLTLIAFLRAKPGADAELGRRLSALVEPTRLEPGCIDYQLHRSNSDPGLWVLYENWRSQADLDLHFQMPYLRPMLADFPQLLRGDMELHYLHKVGDSARSG